ncbi:MAG: RDD family protein [Candidatus Riflebacteria bacterium]|nr:RDD family protein [Candidatus Riflebacteria bacterium]
MKSQNLSVLLTDLQGFTSTSSASSRADIVALIRRHNQLMMPVIKFYGGTYVKSVGDALLCTFQSSTDAVVCGIIIQLLLKEYNSRQQNEARRMNLRVVINSGDVSLENKDIYGEAVNITFRMEGLPCFPGGTIGISESTYLLMNRSEIISEKIGPQTLKGIPEPVTVYQVPLEKQRLTTIPARLLQLVEKAVEGGAVGGTGFGGDAAANMTEWANAVTSFLKEKNWGESVHQVGQQVGQKVGQLQNKLVSTFGQKTVIEKNEGKTLSDARIQKRLITFAIDMLVILVVYTAIYTGWWGVQRIVFGAAELAPTEYIAGNSSHGNKILARPMNITGNIRRPMGIAEWIIDTNVKFPFILMYLYFAMFWKIKGATLGQIAGHTAVVSDDGQPITWNQAMKRSGLFLLSTLFFGAGAIMIFTTDKKTLFDKIAETRVIE